MEGSCYGKRRLYKVVRARPEPYTQSSYTTEVDARWLDLKVKSDMVISSQFIHYLCLRILKY